MNIDVIEQAKQVMRRNDRGRYTVPTHGLYPFQWNWDSALSALGFSHFDEARAWAEIETLFDHQWDDGCVPHIIFHEPDDGYFPGPEIWATGQSTPTSGITQPPVAGFAIRRLLDRAQDRTLAEDAARALLPRVQAWHRWFYTNRDPEGTGLVAIIHPWESGRDNSVDWDKAFERVPTDGLVPFTRLDTKHANPDHRPTQAQYERYIWLIQHFRSLDWDNTKLHDASPFRIVDPGFNAILIRSCHDLADVAERLGVSDIATEARAFANKGLAAMDSLWSESCGQYLCFDRVSGELIESPSVAGLLAAFCPLPGPRLAALADRIEALADHAGFLVPSHDPSAVEYDRKRYWRGPVWLIVNYMIADGLDQAGRDDVAGRIRSDCLGLIERGGFAEYYDPKTGEPCGGGAFTWTAAMVIEIIQNDTLAA